MWTHPCNICINGVGNFAKVTPKLWRGAQPTEEGFRNLEKAGVKTIISLRDEHDDYDDFAKLGGANTLKYIRIPMHAWDPDKAQLIVLMNVLNRALKEPASYPVFIHCAEGKDRTGYSVATYRMLSQDWDANNAILEMYDFGFNEIWFRNPDFLKSLEKDKVKFKELIYLTP
jgi:protein tyrosine/serine phosphatase